MLFIWQCQPSCCPSGGLRHSSSTVIASSISFHQISPQVIIILQEPSANLYKQVWGDKNLQRFTNRENTKKNGGELPRRSPRPLRSNQLPASLPCTIPTVRKQALLDNKYNLRPLHDPLFPFENISKIRPEQYLLPYATLPYSKDVADWMQKFFGLGQRPNFRKVRNIEPIRPNAPTTISLFYYDESSKRPLDTYMRRIQDLADMGEQTIIYVPPALAEQVKAMRNDIHWCVVSDFQT